MKVEKVLYFLDFPNAVGGAANTLIRQAAAMKKHISVFVTIPLDMEGRVNEELPKLCKQHNLPYTCLKYSVSITAENVDLIGLKEEYEVIAEYIRDYGPDIVHSTQINICVETACRELGIPHIMNIYPCTEYLFPMEYPDIFPHYHISDSEYYQNRWKERLHVDSVCIRNMCNRVDTEKYKSETPIFICAGVFCTGKNQLGAIKAAHRMLNESMPIKIIFLGSADNTYAKKCTDYIERNHINSWIEIKGFVSSAEREIAKCDALICCSTSESFPNVIGEAMAGKTIVISTPVGGVPEILKDTENAYLCKGFTVEDIYTEMKRFYIQRNTPLQKEIAEKAFQTYLSEFSAEAVEKKILSFYKYVKKDNSARVVKWIQKEELLAPYNSFIVKYKEHRTSFCKYDVMKNMIWLIPYIEKSIKENPYRELIIWGAGTYGADAVEFAKLFFPQINSIYFTDQKKDGEYLGYPIKKTDEINWEKSLIWIAFVYNQMEAINILLEKGLKYHRDFFFLAPVNL